MIYFDQAEMQKFTTLIVNKMKDNKLFASQGGPIILAQVFFPLNLFIVKIILVFFLIKILLIH